MLNIANDLITSDRTPHTAKRLAGHQHLFQVSWMPLYPVGRNAAIAAMTIADEVGDGDQPVNITLIDKLAAHIGMPGASAIARVMEPPDECELFDCSRWRAGTAGTASDRLVRAARPRGHRGGRPGIAVQV
jgi:hypothetical protein